MENKNEIRKSVKAALAAMSPQERVRGSLDIVTQLLSLEMLQRSRTVMLFSPLPSEPDITPLYDLLADKTLLLPSVVGDDIVVKKLGEGSSIGSTLRGDGCGVSRSAIPSSVATCEGIETSAALRKDGCGVSRSALRCGAFGIMEPDTDAAFDDLASIDVVLVPGVAFTPDGDRLGRGRGYYDRFLAKLPASTLTIGLCYPSQLLPQLPIDPWDRKLDKVISAI